MTHGFKHPSNFWVNNVKSRRMVRRLLQSPDSWSLSESRLREEENRNMFMMYFSREN